MNFINADNEYYSLMSSWYEDEKWREVDFRFPFKEFTVSYEDGSKVVVECIGAKKCSAKFGIFNIVASKRGNNLVAVSVKVNKRNIKDARVIFGINKMLGDIYKIIMYFIARDKSCSYSRELERVNKLKKLLSMTLTEPSSEPKTKIQNKYNRPSRNIIRVGVSHKYRKRSSLDENHKRGYHRVLESWEVRGHYRKYKSGKVVWVEAFGKGKGKAKDREYILR